MSTPVKKKKDKKDKKSKTKKKRSKKTKNKKSGAKNAKPKTKDSGKASEKPKSVSKDPTKGKGNEVSAMKSKNKPKSGIIASLIKSKEIKSWFKSGGKDGKSGAMKSGIKDGKVSVAMKSGVKDGKSSVAMKSGSKDIKNSMAMKSGSKDIKSSMAMKSGSKDIKSVGMKSGIKNVKSGFKESVAMKSGVKEALKSGVMKSKGPSTSGLKSGIIMKSKGASIPVLPVDEATKKPVTVADLDPEKAKKIEKNKMAIEQIINLMKSVKPDEITPEIKADLIKIHALARAIQIRYAHQKAEHERDKVVAILKTLDENLLKTTAEKNQMPLPEAKEEPKEIAKEPPKEDAKEPPKEPPKEEPKEPPKDEPSKEGAKEPPKEEPPKEPPKEEPPKEPPKDEPPKEPAKDEPPKEGAKEPPKEEPPKEAPKEEVKEPPKEEAKEPPKEEAKEAPKAVEPSKSEVVSKSQAELNEASASGEALWRQSFVYSTMLMMVLTVVLQPSHNHSKLVHAKEYASQTRTASAVSNTPGHFDSIRLDPVLDVGPATMTQTRSQSASGSTITKKPKYSSASYSALSSSNKSPFVLVSSNDDSHYEAQTQMSPNDPCYNFTIGNENSKEFYSPNYPNSYPNDTECERVIRAPHGHQISIEFRDQFHLEDATNCEYDYLEIRDGAYGFSTPLAKLCGPDFPRDITSNDRFLFLRFVSDDSIEYQGFRAVYNFIKMSNEKPEPPHECRFNKTGVSGIIDNREIPIELTNYSITQDVSIDCMWNITVAPGYKMYLNFKEYKLSSPNNCEANYIDIYGDKLSDLGRKQRFCGTQAEPVRSDGNHMNIRFFAKPDALSNVQFEITFTAFRELPNKEDCRKDEFNCEDSTCIDLSLKCDGVDNCKYRYDEDKQTTCAPGNKGVLNLNSQHMVVILIVFCALVFGMCASITISCWSKIEERRQRKREYKLRRSRETSMEVGLDRTMTITSLDRSTTGCALEHVEQASSSSGSRCRKIITANAIRHKGDVVDDDVMDGPSMAYYDSEENGCYVPDMDIASMHHHPSSTHHHLVYPPSTERRPKQPQNQPNGGTLCTGHHLESGDKYSPDTPTPPQMLLGSPNGPGGGQSPLVPGEYYQQQSQLERDSIRSGSECSIPPPPPPPALSHFRNRLQQQQQFRTLPLDASKLNDSGMLIMGDNHQTLPYRHPQHMTQRMATGPMTMSQQQLMMHAGPQQQQHHPDCAQHQLNKMQQNTGPVDGGCNPNSLRRNYYNHSGNPASSNNRPSSMPIGGNGDTGEMLNDEIDDVAMMGADDSGVGISERRSAMELNGDGVDDDVLTENDINYPSSNGRLPSANTGPAMQQQQAPQSHHQPQHHYLMRAQSTLDDEDDSSVPLNSTNSNPGYSSNMMTPGHHRQPYYRSEAVIEMGPGDSGALNTSGAQMRQGVAIMR